MANNIYPKYKRALLEYTTASNMFDITAGTIKVALISTTNGSPTSGDVTSPPSYSSTDEYWSAIHANLLSDSDVSPATAGAITDGVIAVETLTNVTVNDSGIVDADNVVFSSVAAFDENTGQSDGQCDAVIIYRDDGSAAGTSRLIAWLDNNAITGLPVTPNGTDINLNWNASGIFQL